MALQLETIDQDRNEVNRLLSVMAGENNLNWRVRSIIEYNPYMASNMDAVMQMAQMPVSSNELFQNAGAMFGMQTTDALLNTLNKYDPSVQRAIFTTFTPAQQQSLRSMGYTVPKPEVDEDGFLKDVFDVASAPFVETAKFVFKGIGQAVSPVLSPTLKFLDYASDQIPFRPYRTIRQLGTDTQIVALLSGLAAAAGVIAAIPTGGASLSLTAVGLGAIGGATAGTLAYETATGNPDDWFNAWARAGNGEQLFQNSGVRRATEILGDPRLVNIAKDVAGVLDEETSLIDLAEQFAGVQGSTNDQVRMKQLGVIAAKYAPADSPQYQAVYAGLLELAKSPLFRDAIKALEQSKITIGKDIANMFNLDPDSSAHRWISGSIDAASVFILDPFILGGKAARAVSFAKRGIRNVDAVSAVNQFRKIAARPEMVRIHEVVADAVRTGSTRRLRQYANTYTPLYNDLLVHSRSLETIEKLDKAGRVFGAEDVVDFIVGSNQLKSIMRGYGVVHGKSYGLLQGLSRSQYAMRTATGTFKDFLTGLRDVPFEKLLVKISGDKDALNKLMSGLPDDWADHIGFLFNQIDDLTSLETKQAIIRAAGINETAYNLGRKAAAIPTFGTLKTLGALFDNISTRVPRSGLVSLDANSPDYFDDINNFVELFKVVGVPSYVREIWKRSIYDAPDIGLRRAAVASMVDTMATSTGIRSTDSGNELLDRILGVFRTEYALGRAGRQGLDDLDGLPTGALPEADMAQMMPIPDLRAMRQSVKHASIMRALAGVSDNLVIQAFQDRYWKPAVLLRFGFLVRNATEDMLAFLARASSGQFIQSVGAQSIAKGLTYKEAVKIRQAGELAPLSKELSHALKKGPVPTHARPIVRIIEKFGQSGSPAEVVLADYGYWLRSKLAQGLGVKPKLWTKELVESADSVMPFSIKQNIRNNLDSIIMGNPYSVRRMIAGGVDPGLVNSAVQFQQKHLAAIMQRVGATSTLPWQNAFDQDVRRIKVDGPNAEEFILVRMNGERVLTDLGVNDALTQPLYEAVYDSVHRLTDDGPARVYLSEIAKVLPNEIFQTLPDSTWNTFEVFSFLQQSINELSPSKQKFMRQLIGVILASAEPEKVGQRVNALIRSLGSQTDKAFDINRRNLDEMKEFFGSAFPGIEGPALSDLAVFLGDEQFIDEFMFVRDGTFQSFLSSFIDTVNVLTETPTEVKRQSLEWMLANLQLDLSLQGRHLGVSNVTNLADDAMPTRIGPDVIDSQVMIDDVFYRSLDDAMRGAKVRLTDEINRGVWDDVLSQNTEWLPSSPGQPYYSIKYRDADKGASLTFSDRRQLLEDSGYVTISVNPQTGVIEENIQYENFADIFGYDLTKNDPVAFDSFKDVVDSFVMSFLEGQPFVISNEAAALRVRAVIQGLLRNVDPADTAPIVSKIWLPIAADESILDQYPDLVGQVGKFWSSTENAPISTASWDPRIYPTPDAFMDQAPDLTLPSIIVDRLQRVVEQRVRAFRRTNRVVRNNVEVYYNVNGRAVKLEPGEIVDTQLDLYPSKDLDPKTKIKKTSNKYFRADEPRYGIPVDMGDEGTLVVTDPNMFDAELWEGTDTPTLLWPVLSPIIIDMAEDIGGRTAQVAKSWRNTGYNRYVKEARAELRREGKTPIYRAASEEGPEAVAEEVVRIKASTTKQVERAGNMLPDLEIAQVYEPLFTGTWNKVVQYGFNKVMSPMLNAITRRPMAFHAFANAYQRNMAASEWLYKGTDEERELKTLVDALVKEQFFIQKGPEWMRFAGDSGRNVGIAHGIDEAIYWSDSQSISFLAGLSPEELAKSRVAVERAFDQGKILVAKPVLQASLNFLENNIYDMRKITWQIVSPQPSWTDFGIVDEPWQLVNKVDAYFGEGSALMGRAKDLDPRDTWLKALNGRLSQEDWRVIQKAAQRREQAYEQAGEYAAQYAIRDIMPFIDTHEVRSQFADWGRGFLPFWYAEENFLKRWARIFTLDGPLGTLKTARQLQLTYAGLKTTGVVREDAQGKSYFVYPGSDLLIEALEKVIPGELGPLQVILQSPTDRMIPGFGPKFGTPGITPIVQIPIEIATYLMPETPLVRNMQRNIFGDIAVSQDVLGMFLPTQVVNTFKAIYEFTQPYDSNGSERIQSAMLAAIAMLEATDQGLPDDATANQKDDFLRTVRQHARIIVLSQAIAGWFLPTAGMAMQLPEGQNSLSWLTQGEITNPAEVLSSAYYELIKNLGIDEGTQEYLSLYPDSTIKDVLSPLLKNDNEVLDTIKTPAAFTVSRTKSKSGSPLPSTDEGIAFYENNKEFFDQYEFAGPWFLPQDYSDVDNRSQYAYEVQLIEGLRIGKTPEQFLNELKFKEASTIYFAARQDVVNEKERLLALNDKAGVTAIEERWDIFSKAWQATHPIFAEYLQSGESRQRRQTIIDEVRYLIRDPEFPRASHFDAMKTLIEAFDNFMFTKSEFALNRTAFGRAQSEVLNKGFEDWVSKFVVDNPMVNGFWLTVLRPETGLD